MNVNCTENSKEMMKLHHKKKALLIWVVYGIPEWIKLEGTTGGSADPSRIPWSGLFKIVLRQLSISPRLLYGVVLHENVIPL